MGNCAGQKEPPVPGGVNVSTEEEAKKKHNLFKILIIGDAGVGKTSLAGQWVDGTYTNNYIATIGVDFKVKKLTIDGTEVKVQVWDTAGQERYNTISSTYYRGCHGVVIVYDVTDKKSFESVKRWITEIEKFTAPSSDLLVTLVGNKSDDEHLRQVQKKEADELCSEKSFMASLAIEASAKTGHNVNLVFSNLVEDIYKKLNSV
ncbi:Ras-related protein Rab [Acrasis kona]|uniref:Ras-related protein Rab n=1 Tax=Acrasis kona TaxID=1008807 RepID=A0AAW2YHV4_9EUKA